MKPLYHCCESTCVAAGLAELGPGLDWLRTAGFDGVEGGVPDLDLCPSLRRVYAEADMTLGVVAYFPEAADPEPLFERAAAAGALYVTGQADGYWRDDAWIIRRTRALIDLGKRYGLPFFLETHRGRYTQDLRRTLWLIEEIPELRLCGDISHYTSSSELKAPWPGEWKQGLLRVAERCGALHGRVNGGQRVQDPLAQISAAQKSEYQSVWRHAFTAAEARGERIIFNAELLPPDYQIEDLAGNPLGNLWEETVALRQWGGEAFAE